MTSQAVAAGMRDRTPQLTSIVAGSLAPIIALWLYQKYDSALPVALYVGTACAISGLAALLARETKGLELSEIR